MKDYHTRARRRSGRVEAVAMVDRTLVRIFLPNGYAFCLLTVIDGSY
jgi:hypothetical protein